jgi:hypothetical protein
MRKDKFHHTVRNILLRENARGAEECRVHLSRRIAIVLHPQLRRNILAYVDDVIVKSIKRGIHISD